MNRPGSTRLTLTRQALDDISRIRAYSIQEWGRRTAEQYLDDLEVALCGIQDQPNLLMAVPDMETSLRFYRVRQHLIFCDQRPDSIVVLTVLHASMDLPARLAKLEPTLSSEVDVLHANLKAAQRSSVRRGRKPQG